MKQSTSTLKLSKMGKEKSKDLEQNPAWYRNSYMARRATRLTH
jgi:hypothetical protein